MAKKDLAYWVKIVGKQLTSKDNLILGVKAWIVSLASMIVTSIFAIIMITLGVGGATTPLLAGAESAVVPQSTLLASMIPSFGVLMAAFLGVLILAIPVYVLVWGYVASKYLKISKGKGIVGYFGVGIRGAITSIIASVIATAISWLLPLTGGIVALVMLYINLIAWGYLGRTYMGFKRG